MANHMVGAVYLLVIQKAKLLVMRRENTGYADGMYSLVSGHMEPGETATQAVIREAKEEVGITVAEQDLDLLGIMHRPAEEAGQDRMDFFFGVGKFDGEVQNMEPDKCGDLVFLPFNKLPENMIPYVKHAIEVSLEATELWFQEGSFGDFRTPREGESA